MNGEKNFLNLFNPMKGIRPQATLNLGELIIKTLRDGPNLATVDFNTEVVRNKFPDRSDYSCGAGKIGDIKPELFTFRPLAFQSFASLPLRDYSISEKQDISTGIAVKTFCF
jgi:hypothetical protein